VSSISSDPENLEAINLLAGMGILTNDDGLVDAALAEMLSLPLDQRVAMDPHHDVDGLLVKHYLGQVSDARHRWPFFFGSAIDPSLAGRYF
jgi:hypothetical protein